ncbi:hypothetical protein H9Q13_15235 [Pontibacter sp. JH31]|uniref:Lipopolysaccharide assembly protein A domain-containing protein n=1 Tax=Pontibacter aquaedesilientis TaxID=2766980 RepID=A0ABR7XJN1_9BACT|nr:hypothetical protein [Pontibacter aquaedesilientis]MBD1398524.1 hypothetical protein [Pontibacter aquaedesilientis]
MKALKTLSDVVVFCYAVFIVLLLTNLLDHKTLFDSTTEEQVLALYKALGAVGAGLMLVKLLIGKLYIMSLQYDRHRAQVKINELKADLYERKQAYRSNSYSESASMEMAVASN